MVRFQGVCLGALMLAGCGSGGSGSSGGSVPVTSGAPTPSPSPSASASPTPSVTAVAPFDQLTGAVTLQTVQASFQTNYTPPQETGINSFGNGVRYQYNATTRAIALDNGPNSPSFTAADIDATTPAGTTRYARANGDQLLLVQPVPGGVGARWTRFIESTGNAPPFSRIVAVTGVPTPGADIPTTGSVTFSRTVVTGDAYVAATGANGPVTTYSLAPSALSASINYATRRITFTLTVSGQPVGGGAVVPLATISGTTDFDGASGGVSATSTGFPQTVVLQIGAALFGTAGAEAGGVFTYRATTADRRSALNLIGRFAAS